MSAPAKARVAGPPLDSSARRFLTEALVRQVARPTTAAISVPARLALPDALLAAAPEEASFLWHPPEGPAYAGVGITREIRPGHEGPFQPLRGRAVDLFRRIEESRHPACTAPALRIFGGVAFAPGAAMNEPWESFGDGAFVLPRWTYGCVEDSAWLTLAIDGELLDDAGVALALAEYDALVAAIESEALSLPPLSQTPVRVEEDSRQAFLHQVEVIRGLIGDGEFQKIVTARRVALALGQGTEPRSVLDRLRGQFPGCTRFALWRRRTVFLGATPECLVSRRGSKVTTEALAGSMALGHAEELLASAKDREEHGVVVEAIVEALRPFCNDVHAAAAPSIRELPNVLHMQTPIEGELGEGAHILDLVQALHPTPAVGGVPTRAAIDWILQNEVAPRGWYSAPFGWLDASGDGSFVVGLRSGVLRSDKAWLFAGAGIMADSDPAIEFEETQMKMGALLGALVGDGP